MSKKTPVVELSRGHMAEFSFNMSHTLPSEVGHGGHDWQLIVRVKGPIDPGTGFVMDAGELKETVMREVVRRFDKRDASEFLGAQIPSIENLIVYIWRRLATHLPTLSEVELWETPKICVRYRGEEVEVDE